MTSIVRRAGSSAAMSTTHGDLGGQLGAAELAPGHVDADAEVRRRADLLDRAREHERVDADDRAVCLGEADEAVGRDLAALGVRPAHQRLDADDAALAQGDDRLVGDAQVAALERHAQVVGERDALQRLRAHLGAEDLDAVLAGALGPVEGDVGVADQAGRGGAGARDRGGDADAHAREELRVAEHDGLGDRAEQALARR